MADLFDIHWLKMILTPVSLIVCGYTIRILFYKMNRHFIPLILTLLGVLSSFALFDSDHRVYGILYGFGCAMITVGMYELQKSIFALLRLRYYKHHGRLIRLNISNGIERPQTDKSE